jgi:hypothetical protein
MMMLKMLNACRMSWSVLLLSDKTNFRGCFMYCSYTPTYVCSKIVKKYLFLMRRRWHDGMQKKHILVAKNKVFFSGLDDFFKISFTFGRPHRHFFFPPRNLHCSNIRFHYRSKVCCNIDSVSCFDVETLTKNYFFVYWKQKQLSFDMEGNY